MTIIPAAELRARVVMQGVKKANIEAMSFHGVLKDISGESAEATLKANYEGRGFDEFKAAMTDAKLRAARPIVQEARVKYDRGAFSDLRREIFLTRKAMSGLGSEHGIGSALAGAALPFGKIGTAAVAASGPVLSLAGGVTAVAGSLVGAAEGAGALGIAAGGVATVGIGSLVAIAVPAIGSLKELTETQKSYIQAVETYGVQSTQAETAGRKLLAAEKMSGKEAVSLVKNLDQVKERWSSLTKPGREAFLGGLSDALDRVDKKLPLLGDAANRSAQMGRKGFDQFLGQVTGSDFDKFVHTMTNTEEHIIPELSRATGDWGRIIERVATDAAPSLERVTGVFAHWSKEVLGSTSNSHKLTGEISHLTDDFMDWVHLLTASGSLLHDIFDAGEGSGNELVVETTEQLNQWGEWIDHHGPKVEAFFIETKDGVEALASILAHTGKDWFVMSEAMEPVETAALHILDDFAQIHIGGQSMLTYLLAGFGLLKVAIAAVKIKDLVEGIGWLKALAGSSAAETSDIDRLVVALQAQTDAASAAAAANADLAASNQAVADSAQLSMLEMGPLADAEKAGQLSMFPMGGGVVAQAAEKPAIVGTEAEDAGGLGAAASKVLTSPFAKAGAVVGGYFAAEFATKAVEGITHSDILEGQSLWKSLFHGFNTEGVAQTEAKAFSRLFRAEISHALGSASASALHQTTKARGVGISKGSREAIGGESEVLGRLKSGLVVELPQIKKLLEKGSEEAARAFGKGSPQFRQAAADNMSAAVAAVKEGEAKGIITVEKGNREIGALLHTTRLVTGNDPFGIARSFTRSWEEVGGANHKGIAEAMREIGQMPAAVRPIAARMMLEQVKKAEETGRLTKGSYARMRSAVVAEFGLMTLNGGASAEALGMKVVNAYGEMTPLVAKALEAIGGNTVEVLKALGAASLPKLHLKSGLTKESGSIKSFWQGRQEGGFIIGGSGSGDRPGFWGEPKGFVLNRNATAAHGFAKGGRVPLALEPGERYFSPPEVQKIGAHNLATMNAAVPRFQKGGMLGPEPQITGPAGSLREIGQDAVHQVYAGAKEYIDAHRPKGGDAEYVGGGGPVAAQMWKSLHAGGYNKIGAAGVIGNAGQESGLNPGAVGSGGGGLLGFTTGEISLAALQAFAKAQRRPWTDVGLQMQFFLDHEAGIRAGVNSQPDAASAATYFMNNWERPAVATENQAHREAVARWAYAQGYQVGGRVIAAHKKPKWAGWTPDGRYSPGSAQALISGGGVTGSGALEHLPTTISPSKSTTQTAAEKATKEAKSKSTPTEAVHWEMSHLGDSDQWGYPGEWCGAFQAAGMRAVGIEPPPGYASASSWASFGTPLGRDHIQAGAILDYGGAHVAMAISSSQQIQGNDQNGQVGTSGIGGVIGGSTLTAVRWPPYKGVTGPGAGAAPTEKVPASFHGLRTGSLHIPSSIPKTIHGIQREEARRKHEKHAYEQAVTAAAGRPKLVAALQHNVTALLNRLEQLRKAAAKLRRSIAEKRFTTRLGRDYSKVSRFGELIEARQRDYTEKSELAEHLVGLEPTEPIMAQEVLPANATEAEQLAAEKKRQATEEAYVSQLTGYIHGQVEPAYVNVLGSEAAWRNTILEAETAATHFEIGAEGHVRRIESRISGINAFTQEVGDEAAKVHHDVDAFHEKHPKEALPPWIKDEQRQLAADEKKRDKMRAHLPVLRYKEAGWREKLGEARGDFYGGYWERIGAKQVQPPSTPLAGTGEFEQALIEVQGTKWPALHERIKVLPPNRDALGLGGAIWDTQTQMYELGLQIAQANASISPAATGTGEGAAAATGTTEREELLEGLLREANQEKLLRHVEEETLGGGLPYMGAFATGGVALVGERGPELAAFPSGTRVHNAGETRATLRPSVVIHHYEGEGRYEVEVDGEKVEARIERKQRMAARRAGRGLARAGS